MVFGKQQSAPEASPHGSATTGMTRDRFVTFLLSVFVGLMLLVTLGGCGSSSGGGNEGNNGNTNTNAGSTPTRLTGRVVNQNNNNAAVAGATISYAGASAVTDNGGNFNFVVSSGQTANLVVVGPANTDGSAGYYNTGYVGSQQYSLGSTGYPVTPITSGETRDVGTVIIFSQTGPPPPPIFN